MASLDRRPTTATARCGVASSSRSGALPAKASTLDLRTLIDAERYLEGFLNRERSSAFDYEELGLSRIRALLEPIGRPEQGLASVHIAGSKGKGSTALATEALLRAAGLRVGTYTSPHLRSWRERFRVDGEPLSEVALVETLRVIRPVADRLRQDGRLCPSFFDVSTALAFEVFRRAGVDAAVIEVGLGGRLDSTNVTDSKVSVLTTVQLEHTDKLGTSLEAIAREKAGILRDGVPLVYGSLQPEALAAVLARAVAEDVLLEEVLPLDVRLGEKGLSFQLADGRRIASQVLGVHQATNLALAVRAAERFLERPLSERELAALRTLQLPARIERFGDIILDSAHTPDSARALRETLTTLWPQRSWVLGIGISSDKDASGILSELAPSARACVVSRADPLRSLEPGQLARLARDMGIAHVERCETPREAIRLGRKLCRPTELLVLTGSIYFAGALRSELCETRPCEVDSGAHQ